MGKFKLEEATIDSIHAAMEQGNLTSKKLVEIYLNRIEKHDKN